MGIVLFKILGINPSIAMTTTGVGAKKVVGLWGIYSYGEMTMRVRSGG